MSTFEERLMKASENLEKLSKKAADTAGDVKAARELGEEVMKNKISDAKGALAAFQDQVSIAEKEGKSRLFGKVMKAQMTVEARVEDLRNALDKKKLERYIDGNIGYLADLYDTISFLLSDAELTALETNEALKEYDEKFGGEEAEA